MMTTSRHIFRKRKGFSLAESLISVVIVGTLMVAALNTVGATTTGRSQVSRKAIAHSIGQSMLAEIMVLAYEDPDQTPIFGRESSETNANRMQFDDVDDYEHWDRNALEKKNGDPLLGMIGWSRHVSVDWVLPNDLTSKSNVATEVKRITVEVNYNDVTMASLVGVRTPGPPEVVVLPKILFLLNGINIASATTTELARIALIESWGYEVVTIASASSQVIVDAELADAVALYIGSEVNPVLMNADFSTTTNGIINEHPDLLDEFGFCATFATSTDTRVNIWDNTHYITSPFVTGWLPIYGTSQPVQIFNGQISTDVLFLGGTSNGGGPSSFGAFGVLNAGAVMQRGGATAGRRVHLPWGQPTFDFNSLNADGQTIMQRSIAWAAGLDTP